MMNWQILHCNSLTFSFLGGGGDGLEKVNVNLRVGIQLIWLAIE